MFTHESESEVACNFNRFIENEELVNVLGTHVHGKSGNIRKPCNI